MFPFFYASLNPHFQPVIVPMVAPLRRRYAFDGLRDSCGTRRVGGRKPIPVDFRLITATNRNLETMVEQQEFRGDLYDRLNIDAIWIPPLRERLEDIPLLVE